MRQVDLQVIVLLCISSLDWMVVLIFLTLLVYFWQYELFKAAHLLAFFGAFCSFLR